MKRLSSFLIAVVCFFSFNLAIAATPKVKDQVIAQVGNYKLTTSYLLEEVRSLPPQLQMVLIKNPQILNRFVDRWINITLMAVAAKSHGLDKKPEVKAQIQDAVNTILARAWLSEKIKNKNIKITEKQIKQYYETHKDKDFTEPKMVKARHILIRVPKHATKKQIEKAKKEAEKIYEMLKNGADFAKLAKKYSQDPGSSERGGELGYFPKGRMVPAFEKVAFSLKPGQISKPFRTVFGYEIVQVEAVRPKRVLPLSEVKGNIKQTLMQKEQQAMLKKLVTKLRKQYHVKINNKVLKEFAQQIGLTPTHKK